MAVVAVRLMSCTHSINEANVRNYVLTYQVETDDKDDGPITVRLASGLPALYDSFEYGNDTDTGAICKSKSPTLVSVTDHRKLWTVVCNFSSAFGQAFTGATANIHPVDYPSAWSGTFQQYQREFFRDKDAAAITNTAGDAFVDPPIFGDDSRPTIVVEKNFASANLPTWYSYRDNVNSAAFWGLAAKTLKIQQVSWQQLYYRNQAYISTRWEFHYNPDTWDIVTLNAGYREKAGGVRVAIADDLGGKIASPAPLDTDGTKLTNAEINAGSQTYVTSSLYTELDFTTIGLPTVVGGA